MSFVLTREQLLADLWQAYFDARRHKRSKPYQQRFEQNAAQYIDELCDDLLSRKYLPGRSTCFIISEPKKREVFAAQFLDRIVHHLYYNYVHEMLERTFIADSYSCIKHRGTYYGIGRLESHIRRESQNYQIPCYVLKMDITGYFMHINRYLLLQITLRQLRQMAPHRVAKGKPEKWNDMVDMEFIEWLTKVIVMYNPITCCQRRGTEADWQSLPREKSLFHSPEGCGLPIGNLTSQLFSNVYLNELDQYVKRNLGCRHYGRYVDDFYIVSADRQWLCTLQQPIATFLNDTLVLEVNSGKTVICDIRYGVPFLGAFIKPHRRYVTTSTIRRMKAKIRLIDMCDEPDKIRSSLNSMLGLLSHSCSYRSRCRLFLHLRCAKKFGYFQKGMKRFVLRPPFGRQSRAGGMKQISPLGEWRGHKRQRYRY